MLRMCMYCVTMYVAYIKGYFLQDSESIKKSRIPNADDVPSMKKLLKVVVVVLQIAITLSLIVRRFFLLPLFHWGQTSEKVTLVRTSGNDKMPGDDAVDEQKLVLCCAVCCSNCSVLPSCEAFGVSGKLGLCCLNIECCCNPSAPCLCPLGYVWCW